MNAPQILSREAINEFKAIYKEEFGKELSDHAAQQIGLDLLKLLKLLLAPD